jgi:alpha-tubulin suppressor-like RCC1 family protein
MNNRNLVLGMCTVLAAVSLVACGEEQKTNGGQGGDGDVGEVVIELTSVPAAVRCIAIDVARSPGDPAPVRTLFTVAANASSANLSLGRLALGFARFSGFAWDLTCADPAFPTAMPSWQALAVDSPVMLGIASHVRLNFYANDPTQVDANFIKDVVDISTGQEETYARFADGTVWQWGALGGNLGNISTIARPFPLPAPLAAAKVAVGFNFACALMTNGTVSCWGFNFRGQLGPGVPINGSSFTPVNVPLPSGSTAVDIATGDSHVCVVSNSGSVICWGDDTFGQLGVDPATLGTVGFTATPAFAFNASGGRIFAGSRSNCVINGSLVGCWGANDFGQLGNGSIAPGAQFAPTFLAIRGVVDLAMGHAHTCALHSDGTVGCWGANGNGQVGDNTTMTRPTEFKVFQANGPATAIIAGANHSCMLSSPSPSTSPDRILTCWGANASGQLGDTTALDRVSPSPRSAGFTGIFSHDSDTTCVTKTGSLDVQCTGFNSFGELGDGTRNTRFQFTSVTF